jgi:hypothetical protein
LDLLTVETCFTPSTENSKTIRKGPYSGTNFFFSRSSTKEHQVSLFLSIYIAKARTW